MSYKTAGQAERQAIERALAARITLRQWRGLGVVLSLTTSYSKLVDRTSARQVAALVYGVDPERVTGSQREDTSHALKALSDAGIIGYRARPGRNAGIIVSIPAFNVGGAAHVNVGGAAHVDEKNVGDFSRNVGDFGEKRGSVLRQHLEGTEEITEERENSPQELRNEEEQDRDPAARLLHVFRRNGNQLPDGKLWPETQAVVAEARDAGLTDQKIHALVDDVAGFATWPSVFRKRLPEPTAGNRFVSVAEQARARRAERRCPIPGHEDLACELRGKHWIHADETGKAP